MEDNFTTMYDEFKKITERHLYRGISDNYAYLIKEFRMHEIKSLNLTKDRDCSLDSFNAITLSIINHKNLTANEAHTLVLHEAKQKGIKPSELEKKTQPIEIFPNAGSLEDGEIEHFPLDCLYLDRRNTKRCISIGTHRTGITVKYSDGLICNVDIADFKHLKNLGYLNPRESKTEL